VSICSCRILEVRQLSFCVAAGFEVICKGGRCYGTRGLEIVLRTTGQESEAEPSQLTLQMTLTKLTKLRKLLMKLWKLWRSTKLTIPM